MKRIVIFLLLLFSLFSCDEIELGATVDTLNVVPNTLSLSDTGMTDEYFTITMKVSGFDGEIEKDSIKVFRQNPRVVAIPESITITGNTIKLNRIAKSWFGGVASGSYQIGVEMSSQGQFINEQDLAKVVVRE